MNFKNETLEELKGHLVRIKQEQVEVDELADSLPKEIETKKEKLRKKRIAFLNAEGWYEDAVDYLGNVMMRKEQLVGIVDALNKEIETR